MPKKQTSRAADKTRLDEYGLEPRQRRFADEWLANGNNSTEAAVVAGYGNSRKVARTLGPRLLMRPEIAAYIAKRQAALAQRLELKHERVAEEWVRIAFSDIRQIFSPDGQLLRPEEWPDDIARAVAGVDVVVRSIGGGEVEYVKKVKLWDKNTALGNAAKYLGMLRDRTDVSVGVTPTLARLLQLAAERASQRSLGQG